MCVYNTKTKKKNEHSDAYGFTRTLPRSVICVLACSTASSSGKSSAKRTKERKKGRKEQDGKALKLSKRTCTQLDKTHFLAGKLK